MGFDQNIIPKSRLAEPFALNINMTRLEHVTSWHDSLVLRYKVRHYNSTQSLAEHTSHGRLLESGLLAPSNLKSQVADVQELQVREPTSAL